MKKMKKSLIAASFLMFANVLSAQIASPTTTVVENTDKYKVETNGFWSDWFISVGGGAQMYFGDHNKQMSFGDRLSPAFDVAVGKWFTPGIGARLVYSGLSINGATQNGSHSNGKVYDASQKLYEQHFNMMNLHGDVLFNLSNLLCGYDEQRFYSLTPYMGLGWMATWDKPSAREVSANLGLLNSFRLSPVFDLNLDVCTSVVNDRFDGEQGGRQEEGLLAVTFGVTYKFNRAGWHRGSVKTVSFSDDELRPLRERLAEMARENESLHARLSEPDSIKVDTIIDTISEKSLIAAPCLIAFSIGKSTLSNENRVNLGFFAKIVKSNKAVVYTITGYADKSTGSSSVNEQLSKARTEAVYDALVHEFGVPASQLEVSYAGGVDNLFYNDPTLSRSVITEAK